MDGWRVAGSYKQIVDRHFHRQNSIRLTILVSLTVLNACGPRSGIHNEQPEEPVSVASPEDTSARHRAEVAREKSFERGSKLFRQNCAVCHSSHTDQKFTGPGLKDVFDRIPNHSEEWFIKYTLNSKKVLLSGDKYARKIHAEYNNSVMTIFEDYLTEDDIKEIINYLKRPPL